MEILEYRLPDYLASYLINGDASGIEGAEQAEIDLFLKRENIAIIDIQEDSSFYHTNDLNNLGCNCSTYIATPIQSHL
jgi:hypothetical protein